MFSNMFFTTATAWLPGKRTVTWLVTMLQSNEKRLLEAALVIVFSGPKGCSFLWLQYLEQLYEF